MPEGDYMKSSEINSKKKILILRILSISSFALSFIVIFTAISLDNNYPEKNWFTYGIIVFLVFNIIGLYLQNKIKADREINRLNNKAKTYENLELIEKDSLSEDELKARIESNGYNLLSNDYYFKLSKAQGICYYLKLVNFVRLDDYLEKELMRFKKFYEQGCKRINGILFVEMEDITESDKLKIKELSKSFLLAEEVPLYKANISINVVLVDKNKGKTYYYESPESFNTRVFTFGVLNIRKIFNKKK